MNDVLAVYMNTHIRINGKSQPEEWTDEQRVCAFAILPDPAITLDQFRERLSIKEANEEPTEEEKLETNEKNLAIFDSKAKAE